MTCAKWISRKTNRKPRAFPTGRALRADTVCFSFRAARYASHYRLECASPVISSPWANFEAYGAFCATMVCVNDACRQGVVVIGEYYTYTPRECTTQGAVMIFRLSESM